MNTLVLYRALTWQTQPEIRAELDARAETLRKWKAQGQKKALFEQLDRAREETESLSWAEQDAFDRELAEAMEDAPEDWQPRLSEAEVDELARYEAMKHKNPHEL